jgi:hypothetical protein
VIMCTECLFTLLFSSILYNERVTSVAFIGFALIFAAILLASLAEHIELIKIKNKQKISETESKVASAAASTI